VVAQTGWFYMYCRLVEHRGSAVNTQLTLGRQKTTLLNAELLDPLE
jgi:hypothetical protein